LDVAIGVDGVLVSDGDGAVEASRDLFDDIGRLAHQERQRRYSAFGLGRQIGT